MWVDLRNFVMDMPPNFATPQDASALCLQLHHCWPWVLFILCPAIVSAIEITDNFLLCALCRFGKIHHLWQKILCSVSLTVKPLITNPPKRTTSVQRRDRSDLPPINFTIELHVIHFEPPKSGQLSTPNNGH